MEGDRTADAVLDTEFGEARPALSPDGRWLAYESNESGQVEIFVRPFPNIDGGKWQVSTAGVLARLAAGWAGTVLSRKHQASDGGTGRHRAEFHV